MLDEYLLTSYRAEKTKTASREVIDRLKQLPIDELQKMASGDPTSKLAFMDPCGASSSWLDQFKGTPLFDQAVAIERNLLEIDAQQQSQRAADQQAWSQRDALQLKRRMLELDLVTSQNGGGPEAQEEKGVQLLEQAQAEERAEGEGGEPHEQAEDQAIQQFRAAQSQEAAEQAPQKPPARKPGPGAEVDTPETDPAEEPPKPKPKSGMSVEVKQAGAWGSDSRRVAPGSNNDTIHPERAQGAGALADHTPSSEDHFGTVTEGKQASAKIAAVLGAGRVLASTGLQKTALSHTRIIEAVRRAPEDSARLGKAFEHGVGMLGGKAKGKVLDQADTLATAAGARLAGGNWKRELTNLNAIRKTSSSEVDAVKAEVGKKYPGLVKKEASVPAAAAGAVAGAHKAQTHGQDARAGVIRGAAGAVGGSTIGKLIGTALGDRYGKPGIGGTVGALAGGLGGYKALTRGLEKKSFVTPGLIGAVAGGKKADDTGGSPLAGGVRGFLGGHLGSELGANLGHNAGDEIAQILGHDNPTSARAAGALMGLAGGGYLGYKALTHRSADKEKSKKKEAGLLGSLATAAPKVMSGLGGALSGAKNLATTAHAAGGLPQVAKSFGNVAAQFAQKNPLAAAGVAGGAGLLAGRALSPSQPRQ